MDRDELCTRAKAFRAMHKPGDPVLLPNVWDAASAVAVVEAGFAAVATSSSAVAAALGWPDHEAAPVEDVFACLARIARVVDVPVTADIEGGYGLAAEVLVERLLAAGAIGCNLEDSDPRSGTLLDPAVHARRLAAVRQAAEQAHVPLVVNARIDVWLFSKADNRARLEDGLRRAKAYRDAGADSVYPMVLRDPDDLAAFVRGADLPVNALAKAGATDLRQLSSLGVARVSFGGSVFQSVYGGLSELLKNLRAPSAS